MAGQSSYHQITDSSRSDYRHMPCASHYICQKYDAAYHTNQRVCCDGICVEDCGFDWVVLTIVIVCSIAGVICCIAICLLIYYSVRGYNERRARQRLTRMRVAQQQAMYLDHAHIRVPSPPAPQYTPGIHYQESQDTHNQNAPMPNSPPPEYPRSTVPPPDYPSGTGEEGGARLAPSENSKTPEPSNEITRN